MTTTIDLHGKKKPTQYDWPEGTFIQGGERGLVFRKNADHYFTAFVEAFPDETFIRGEGETIEAAETSAWEKYQRYQSCPGHDYEPRNYHNGAGFCKHCGRFKSKVFSVDEVGVPCVTCGVKTNWAHRKDGWFCEEHDNRRSPAAGMMQRLLESVEER